MKIATMNITGLKVGAPLDPACLPRDLVPMDGPAGEPVLDLVLATPSGPLTVRARINGKNYRKMMKQIEEVGPAGMSVILQGTLKAPSKAGEPFVLEGAGFQANVKQPKAEAAPVAPAATQAAPSPPPVPSPAPVAAPSPAPAPSPSGLSGRVRSSAKGGV